MKKVITYGTFDLFHIGHLKLLQRIKNLGDRLIVAVSTDEFNTLKGKKTIIPYEQRAEIVSNIKCVDFINVFYMNINVHILLILVTTLCLTFV